MRVQIRICCLNTLPYKFLSKRETACSLYVFQCCMSANFSVVSDRLNWRNNTTSNHELSFKMPGWPCHGIISGENNVQAWQIVQVLYFGVREHLFIYSLTIFYTFVKQCGCQSIWDLKFEEYWEECDQLSDTHVIVHNTLILICLLLDAFLDIASFKPCHE